ncbi:RNA methyltransferase RsmE [Treponema sp. OMZ 838]|uniref:RsmE family RNA methyltransferase n=1 Tax=Treponema sp. OMZ 838 TaxID=1539298 RepID=UPI0005300DDD|nr:RsmE family RNA methyltransferase [Treponema sp. OMZ 838]AIW89124.1 RNA methyltransferase RsmE [Treponema sp. OMZ 838]
MKQFIIEQEPDSNGLLTLSGKAFVYLIKVRRMREGDILPAVLPQSGTADMVIDSINTAKKTLRLKRRPTPFSVCGAAAAGATNEAANSSLAYAAPAADLILLQWVLKGSKTDTIIRQATEAGVRAVLPVIGEFSIAKKQNPAQLERFRRIIKEARQQSGSPVDTIVMEPAPLAEMLNTLKTLVPAATTVFAQCSEAAGTSVGFHQLLAEKPSHIVLAIGAEGGISPAEAAILREAAFQTIHFKTNVLRAETAALYAIAAAQTTINEADQWHLPV